MRRPRAGAMSLLVCLSGCTGGGRIEFAALDWRNIDPPAAAAEAVSLDECYWWTEEDGSLWLSMRRRIPSILFGALGEFTLELSFVLDRLPAGRERTYSLGDRSMRGVARQGPSESRFKSLVGVAAVSREPIERLSGSFRVQTSREILLWLGNWSRPSRYMIQGRFEAVQDSQRGRAIRESTESPGWERGPAPTSRPAQREGAAERSTRPAGGRGS